MNSLRNRWIKYIYFGLVYLFSPVEIPAQLFYTAEKINQDSLSSVLQKLKGEPRILALNKLASSYSATQPELSLKYAREADNLLPKDAGNELFFKTRLTLGQSWMSLGSYNRAIVYLLDAYEAAIASGRLDWQYAAGKPIMLTYLYTRNYDIAERMLAEFMDFDHSRVPGNLLFEILISAAWANWSFLENYEKALNYQHICLSISDTFSIRRPNLALCLYQMAICQHNLKRYDSADIYFRKAEKIVEMSKISSLEQYHLYWVYNLSAQGKSGEALKMIQSLTEIMEARQHYAQAGTDYIAWGKILKEMKQPEESVSKFEKALELGQWVKANKALSLDSAHNMDYWYAPEQNTKNYIEEIGIRITRDAHFNLYQQYQKLKNLEKALHHHVRFEEEKSSLVKLERNKMLMEADTRYQTQKKEQQIISLTQQNKIKEDKLRLRGLMLASLAGLLIVTGIITTLLIRHSFLKNINRSLVLEQKLLRSQMNPHFIFNTLSSIQFFILQEDPDKASRYLAKFSKLVRNILDNSLAESVTLSQEISTLENYLELQKIRYNETFDYLIQVDEGLEADDILIPPMLCQPFVENSIEHGFKYRENPGLVEIHVYRRENDLVIRIKDNGIGRSKAKEIESANNNDHRSLATNLISDRLKILNRKPGRKIRLEITDITNKSGIVEGTKVILVFSNEMKTLV